MKIVINKCYGDFSLSEKAINKYAKEKGIPLFIGTDQFGFKEYWTVPENERVKPLPEPWNSNSMEERGEYSKKYTEQHLYDRDIKRTDEVLVRVVESLGEAADGEYAQLKIVEIPDGVEWAIEEYDGLEWVAEIHRTWG